MYEFWSDYTKIKPGGKICYMDTDNFIVYIKTENIYICRHCKRCKTMANFVALRSKKYSLLEDGSNENKKAKSTKKFLIKHKLKFEGYKNCLEANSLENIINYLDRNKIDAENKKNH